MRLEDARTQAADLDLALKKASDKAVKDAVEISRLTAALDEVCASRDKWRQDFNRVDKAFIALDRKFYDFRTRMLKSLSHSRWEAVRDYLASYSF